MTITDYFLLTNEEQWDMLWDQGIYLTTKKSIECDKLIFTLFDFYVEATISKVNGQIMGKRTLPELDMLNEK